MAGEITGSIKALIGADTSDYNKAMQQVLSVTNSTMNQVASKMSSSTNSIVSKVGSIMSQLSATIPSKLNGLKTSLVAPFSTAGGQIQRVIANIGAKIPEPFRSGFSKVSTYAKDAVNLTSNALQKLTTKSALVANTVGSKLTSAFNKAG